MKINDKFSITKDAHNYIVECTTAVPAGKPIPGAANKGKLTDGTGTTTNKSYYPTLKKACLSIISRHTETQTLKAIITTIDQSTADIVAACEKVELQLKTHNKSKEANA